MTDSIITRESVGRHRPIASRLIAFSPPAFLVVMLLFQLFETASKGTVNPFETGIYLAGAKRVLAGQRVCGDFISIYGCLIYYIHAAAIYFTHGDLLWSAALPSILNAQLLLLATWRFIRNFTTNHLLILLAMWSSQSYAAGGLRMTIAIVAIGLAIEGINKRKLYLLAAAGLMASVNMAYWRDMGVFAGFAAFILALLSGALNATGDFSNRSRTAIKYSLYVIAGFVAGVALLVAWNIAQHCLGLWFEQTFLLTIRVYDKLPMGVLPKPWSVPPLAPGVHSLWARVGLDGIARWFFYTLPFYAVPGIALIGTILSLIALIKQKSGREWWLALLGLSLLGLIASRTVLRVADELKLKANSLPAALIIIATVGVLVARRSIAIRTAGWTTAALLFIFTTYPVLQDAWKPYVNGNWSATRSLVVRACGTPEVYSAAMYVKSHAPGGTLFAAPTLPLLYVATQLDNPTRLDYLDPIVLPENETNLVADLGKSPPRFAVIDTAFTFWDRYKFGKDFGKNTLDFVHTNYVQVAAFGSIVVFERRTTSK